MSSSVGTFKRPRSRVAFGLVSAVISVICGVASEASAVTLESVDTAFEIDTDPGETPFAQMVQPGADAAEGSTTLPQDWAGEGNQAAPGLTIHTDLNYTPLPEVPADDPTAPPVVPDPVVPDDLTVDGIKADCAETQDDISNLDEDQMSDADPVMAGEPTTPAGDLSDLCQVLHATQGAPNTNGTVDQILYLGASFLGDGEQVDSYTLWYELNQYNVPADGVAADARYRTEDDILIGFDYRGPHAGTVRGYRFTADRQWAATTLVEDVHFVSSAPAEVAFAEVAINLTSSQLLARQTGTDAITYRSARAMTSVLDQADPVEGEEYTPLAPSAPADAVVADLLELSALDSVLTNANQAGSDVQPQPAAAATTMSIAIRKVSQPADGTGFAFTSTTSPAAFTLDHGGTQTFRNLFPGSYTFTEGANADYRLASINCVGTSGDRITTNLANGSVTVNGVAGEAITCVFTNQAPSSLTVVKQTAPANAAPIFEFNAPSLGEPVFGLSDGDSLTVADLEPGTYSVTEADAGDWLLNPVTCVGATRSTVTRVDRGVSVNLAAGEDVVCTFLNIRTDVPLLTVLKQVVNNDGGTLSPNDVTLNVSGVGTVEHGVAVPTEVGTSYTVSETPVAGYQQTGILCVDAVTGLAVGNGATFTAATDVDVTCTITNNDIAPTITVQKAVVNNNGGTLQATDFDLTLSGAGAIDAVNHNQAVTVEAGVAYTVGEQNIPAAYTQQSVTCVVGTTAVGSNGVLTLRPGQNAVCTVVNNDIGPRLTVNAGIINDNGGTAAAGDFALSITPGATGDIDVADPQFGVLYELTEGASYTVSLADPLALGYDFVSIVCVDGAGAEVGTTQANGDVTVTVSVASAIICTVNVDDIPSFITVVKDVTNDDGGTLTPQDFALLLDGVAPTAYAQPVQVNAGTHTISEDLAGVIAYDMTRIECIENNDALGRILNDNAGSLTVTLNQNVTCTVFNDDIAPRITVNKTVINDNGGTLLPGDFELTYTGPGNTVVPMLNGIPSPLVAGTTYTISETDPTNLGYRLVTAELACTDQTNAPVGQVVGTGVQVTPAVGQIITCTMVNDDIPATVTIEKVVNPTSGGNELPTDFTLLLNDGEVAHLATVNVLPGTHTVSEAPSVGYSLQSVVCVDAANPNNQIDIDGVFDIVLGQNVECIISNSDVAPTLTLVKAVTNDNGGNLTADDFSYSLAGLQTVAFPVDGTTTIALDSNTAYSLTEVNPLPLGYAVTNTICESDLADSANTVSTVNNAAVALNLAEGENVTCVIVNDDLAPSLTVNIAVDNADGGQATPADFLPTAGAVGVTSGVRREVLANTDYAIGYTLLSGYQFEGVTCVDEATNGNVAQSFTGMVTVQVQNAQSVVCTITVTDIAPTVVLIKDISLFDNGGTALAGAFQLQLEGANVAQGATTPVDANQPVSIGEVPVLGYAINSITCSDGVVVTNGVITLGLAQNVTCTVFNDDVPPTLTITKTVTNDNGGSAVVGDFPLSLTSTAGTVALTSGATPIEISTGLTYSVGEANPAALGYAVQSFVCVDQNNTSLANATTPTVSFSVVLGQQVSCALVNNDVSATVTVNKVVTNNNGGNDTATSFTYQLDNNNVVAGASTNVLPGAHTVAESANAGYINEGIVCRDAANPTGTIGANGTFNAALGQQITCTITNNDIAPTLTLIKEVTNNSGGTLVASDFDFSVGGITAPFVAGAAGTTVSLTANTPLTLSELNATSQGYNLTGTVCTSDVAGSANTRIGLINADVPLNLTEGEDVVCTMSNNDAAATLTVIKNPVTDNGGNAEPVDFPLTISPALPEAQTLTTGVPVEVNQGVAYTIGENLSAVPGYVRTSTVCIDNTTSATVASAGAGANVVVTLAARQIVTCTITNDDIAPTLTFVKNVINDNGGTLVAADFALQVNGTVWNPALGAQIVRAGVPLNLTETAQAGYANQGVVCTDVTNGSTTGTPVAGGTITLALDQDMSCVVTNNDIAPTLTITKTVTNNNGGTLGIADFPLTATSTAGNIALTSGAAPVAARAGVSYTIGEANPAAQGYAVDSLICVDQNNASLANATTPTVALTLALGQAVSCTLANNDISATVTVNKVVTNDNGGNDTAASFTYQLDGNNVVAGATTNVLPGVHTVAESANAGYVNEGIVCRDAANPTGTVGTAGSVPVTLGQQITCTITNNDIAPTVRIVKTVVNDSGGALGATAFTYNLGGQTGPFVAGAAGTTLTVAANTALVLTEADPTGLGYNLTGTVCTSDVAGSANARIGGLNAAVPLNLVEGEDVVCTMTNNDAAATLTVVKNVVNDAADGGTAVAANFPLTITPALPNGATLISGPAFEVNQGVAYTINEVLTAVPGYAHTGTTCVDTGAGNAVVATATSGNAVTVTLAARQNVTCTITNNDIAPTLTFTKAVINDNGGTAVAANFTLQVNANTWNPALGAQNVTAGVPLALGEVAVAGYANTGIVCTDITDPANPGTPTTVTTITLALDQDMRCVITNNDIAPTLTLTKAIVNTGGGTITNPAAFTLAVNGNTFPQGAPQAVPANTNLTITETTVAGYQLESIVCTAAGNVNVPVTAGVINLALGQVVSCIVTNGDIDPTLAVAKTVVNDNGGNAVASDFSLLVNGTPQAQGPAVARTAGVQYVLSEPAVAGYVLTGIACTGGTLVNNNNGTSTLTLALGDVASCTFTNNDVAPQITLVKNAVLDSSVQGATVNTALFGLTVAPTTASPTGGTFATGAVVSVPANAAITVGEIAPTALGFALTGIECLQGATVVGTGGTLTLNEGQNVTCTVTNNDIAPVLNVRKAVAPEFASLIALNAFTLTVTDGLTQTTYPGTGGQRTLVAGAQYTVGENAIPAGWELVGISCVNDAAPGTVLSTNGTITLGRGETGTCTVTNRPINPTVTINKVFINNSQAGTPTSPNPALFGLRLTSGATVTNVASGQTLALTAGQSYTVSEDLTDPDLAATGYAFQAVACSVGGVPLAGGGTFTAQPGQVITCNVVNDDIAPVITLNKVVITDNGGNDAPGSFQLTLTPAGGATANIVQGAANTVLANQAYTISEVARPGYIRTGITCTGGTVSPAGVITPLLGQTINCTVTNDDQPATIRVLKTVVGGNLAASPATFAQFITLNGAAVTLGGVVNVPTTNGPSFDVVEDQEAATALGYVNTGITCVDQTGTPMGVDGANVVPTEGQNITCTVENTFITPNLIITKSVIGDFNPNDGADFFEYTLGGTVVPPNELLPIDIGTSYTIAETDPTVLGYETVGITCTDSADGLVASSDGSSVVITIATSTIVTCVVLNRGLPAEVFVNNVFFNAAGEEIDPVGGFEYTVDGAQAIPFDLPVQVSANTPVDISVNVAQPGAWATDISCAEIGGGAVPTDPSSPTSITIGSLNEGQQAVCTFIHTQQPPRMSFFFSEIIDNGGTIPAGGFSATVTLLPTGPTTVVFEGGTVTTAPLQRWAISISPIAAQWSLFAIDCFDELGNSPNNGGLVVTIPATGGDVQCTIVVDDLPVVQPLALEAPLVEEPPAEPVPGDVPPVDQPVVDPQPPVDEPVVDPQPPVDQPPVDPQPPVDEPVVDPQPPVDQPPVDPLPPVDPVVDPVVVPEAPLPQDPEGIVAAPEEQPTTQQPTDQPVPPVDPPAPPAPAEEPAPPAEQPPADQPPV